MGFLDFLGKKNAVPVTPAAPKIATPPIAPAPTAPSTPTALPQLDLPDLPSFDEVNTSTDLPPLPQFGETTQDSFSSGPALPDPFANEANQDNQQNFDFTPPNVDEIMRSDVVRSASPSVSVTQRPVNNNIMPQSIELPNAKADSDSFNSAAPSQQLLQQYGPVYCNVEAYRIILQGLGHIRDEIHQVHTFSENNHKLQSKIQSEYDSFHASISTMAKKILTAEAKLFK